MGRQPFQDESGSVFITVSHGTSFTAAITPTHDRVTERKSLIGQ
jgi:hypothetical protein